MPNSSAREKCWWRASGWSIRCCWRAASIPAGPNRLDDLCARYGIDNSRRTKHGALLDAELLAEVYLELIGARQAQLILVETGTMSPASMSARSRSACGRSRLPPRLSAEEREAHAAFVATLGESAIWREYLPIGAWRRARDNRPRG